MLSDADIFVDGDWIESKDQDPSGDVRLIQLADIGDGSYIDKSDRYLTSDTAKRLKCTFLKKGDILLARMPDPLGRACIFPGDTKKAVTVVDVCIIRVNEEKICARWLMYALNSSDVRNQIASFATGTTRSRVSRGNLGKVVIPVVPLERQRIIADILDKADAIRTKRREALALLDGLAQSIFFEMFGDLFTNSNGYPVSPLGKVCDVRDGTHDSPAYVSEGYPLVTSKNLKDGVIDLMGANYISEFDYNDINRRSKVDIGDILMPMIGTIGNPVMVKDEPNFAIKNMALIKFKPSSPSAEFVFHFLNGNCFDRLVANKNKGGTQKFLALGEIRGLPLPIPPADAQLEFSRRIKALTHARQKFMGAAQVLENLFASLQYRAFQGEL
nr:restriction endonuclease subunit S [Pseudomonas aromaticivorans]